MEPLKPELIGQRIREIKDGGVTACASLTPQRVEQYAPLVLEAELDVLVIQGTVVSAEHVSKDPSRQPLNLKRFIREFELPVIVGGCASYSTALHLMRTGAVGVLVGVGPGHACTTPRRARHRRSAGDRDRRRRGRPHPSPRRDRRLRARHRRRRDAHRWRHRQGDRVRRRRGDDRLAARRRVRVARPRLPLGHGHVPPHAAARRAGARRAARPRSPRSSSAPRTRTTAASTSSVRCARRWPPPATRRSRSSRRPRSWSLRGCRPRASRSSAPRASAWANHVSTVPEVRPRPRRRFRSPVRTADRATGARRARVLARSCRARCRSRRCSSASPRRSSSRAARRRCTSRARRRSTPRSTTAACRFSASVTARS